MRPRLSAAVSLLALAIGCSSGEGTTPSADPDTGAVADTDASTISTDTGADTEVTPEETNAPFDSATDTSIEETTDSETTDSETTDSETTDSAADTADAAETADTLDTADAADTAHTSDTDTVDAADTSDTADTAETFSGCDPSAVETCNNRDDDCDGLIDEGVSQPCGSSVGACRAGFQLCTAGTFGGACIGGVGPAAETCNGIDDDCDGMVDEGVTRPCGSSVGACRAGVETCSAGSFGTCVGAVGPATEVCDNLDNNCNGSIDEGITRSCYTGPAGTAGVGQCVSGSQTCAAGSFGTACPGEVLPGTETCNGADQDCDGVVDDGCPASIAFTFAALTPAQGSSGGTLYADRCAAGYAVSAIKVTTGSYVQRVQVICTSIAVTESRSATPYSYSLTVGATVTLPQRGLFAGTVATAECPPNTFAYAISGRAALVVDGIQLHCASLALTGSAPGSFAITRTVAASSSYVGGGGGLAFGPDACAGNQVAMGVDIRAADSIDNIRLACGTPTIVAK